LGERAIGGTVTVKVAVAIEPLFVVTVTVLAPLAASDGTLRLAVQLPELSMSISVLFHALVPNFMPPLGILSSGTKLEPVIVTVT
jgi:hypothetical protein